MTTVMDNSAPELQQPSFEDITNNVPQPAVDPQQMAQMLAHLQQQSSQPTATPAGAPPVRGKGAPSKKTYRKK